MNPEHLFSFTPSMMSSQTLEELLVQRQALAQRLVDLIHESAQTANKHHALLIGPRGMGKTHLVALVYHRIKALSDLTDNLRIAWMQEEEWGVDSFLDLLLRICRALQTEYPDTFPADQVESLYQQPPEAAEKLAQRLLIEFVGSRTLLMLVENLDDLFKGLGETGQRRWRAFLQETAFTTLLATSQSLFNGVNSQKAPFYGFFRTYALDEFTVEDATHLLENIAHHKSDNELAAYLETPAGRARVRAVNHLAGGNPRVYVIFSDFLTRESLDALVDPFLGMLDALTPYYQSRLTYLSTQQRKIVEFLCDRGAPAIVKEIARRCFITSQTASSQLKDLKEKGYVIADPLGPTGRDTYYELREPLLRMSLEVKKSRSGPIRLLIDFLRLWYPISELRHQLDLCKSDAPIEREYLSRALEIAEANPDPRVDVCNKAFDVHFSHRQYAEAFEIAEELLSIQPDANAFSLRGLSYYALGDIEKALIDYDKSLELDDGNAITWNNHGFALRDLGKTAESEKSFKKVTELNPYDASAWSNLAHTYETLYQSNKALRAWQQATKLQPKAAELWIHRGRILLRMRKHNAALASFARALKLDRNNLLALTNQARALWRLGRISEALASCDRAIQLDEAYDQAWYVKGEILSRVNFHSEAIKCYKAGLKLNPSQDCLHYALAETLIASGDFASGLTYIESGLKLYDGRESHLVSHTISMLERILHNLDCSSDWSAQAVSMTKAYDAHDNLKALSLALVENITEITASSVSSSMAKRWHKAWESATGGEQNFELPLRLLDATLRYQDKHDKRVLLELPIEERKILDVLLDTTKDL